MMKQNPIFSRGTMLRAAAGFAMVAAAWISGCSGGSSGVPTYPLATDTRIIRSGDTATYGIVDSDPESGARTATLTATARINGTSLILDSKVVAQTQGGPVEITESETYRQTDGDVYYQHRTGFALEIPRKVQAGVDLTNIRRVCAEENENGVCQREIDESYRFKVTGQETVTVPAGKFAVWVVEVTEGSDVSTWRLAPQLGMFPVKVTSGTMEFTLTKFTLK